MMTADLALALLINRTSAFYDANPPVYMTYTEHTRVTAPTPVSYTHLDVYKRQP